MTTATRLVRWDRGEGRGEVVATVEVTRGYRVYDEQVDADGYEVIVTKRDIVETTTISISVSGKDFGIGTDATAYYHLPQVEAPESIKAAGLVLQCGDTIIGIAADNAERVKAAIAEAITEAEQDTEWADILTQRAEMRAYEEHTRRVERMMTLNGHTY